MEYSTVSITKSDDGVGYRWHGKSPFVLVSPKLKDTGAVIFPPKWGMRYAGYSVGYNAHEYEWCDMELPDEIGLQ
jgi:hypothetical protein